MAFFVEICPICPKFSKIFILNFCNVVHSLHLYENFSAFNVNIEDFSGKIAKMTMSYPHISYTKGKTPGITYLQTVQNCDSLRH